MSTSRGASGRPPRILIVDGNRIFLRTLERTLQPDGYEFRRAADVPGALAEIARGGIDLLITEISLPGLSGFDLIRRIRHAEPAESFPVIVLTSVAEGAEIDRARALGVADLLLKPVRPQLVRERVREVLEKSGRLDRAPAPPPRAAPGAAVPAAASAAVPAAGPGAPVAPAASTAPPPPVPAISPLADPRMRDVRLPVFRVATHRVLELLGDPDTTVKQVARVIETDPGLSGSVLKVVNSAYYGLRKAVGTVADACALLGLRDLGSICLGASVSELLLVRDDPVSRDCWSLCLATGYASREIGNLIQLPRLTDPGIAGILHGVGILAAAASPKIDHLAIRARVEARRCRWAEAERELLGFDHAELGGAIVRQWGLPQWVARVIEASEDPAKVTRPDEWAVAVASLAVQRTNEHALPRHPVPKLLLADLAQLRPNSWELVEPRLEAIAVAAWEQPDPAGVLLEQE